MGSVRTTLSHARQRARRSRKGVVNIACVEKATTDGNRLRPRRQRKAYKVKL